MLLVPQEIKKDINPFSGYIDKKSKFADKPLKYLFWTNENKKYLVKELYSLITNVDYVTDHYKTDADGTINNPIAPKYIVKLFLETRQYLDKLIDNLVEVYQLPFPEDLSSLNPVIQLNTVNLDFVVKAANNIIQSPQNLIPDFNNINPVTGKLDNEEYEYTTSSYIDGTWHPEDLFTNSRRNKHNPYWVPLEVNIYSDPDETGVTNIYNNILYNRGTAEKTNNFSQFPLWQTSVNKRFYERENIEGLDEGGNADRRTQIPHGYNMKKLYKKPNY